MPPFRTPGHVSSDKGPSIADGTLARTNSQVPSAFDDTGSSLYHEYTHTTILCKSSEMSLDAVFALMLSSAKYIAPTDETAPVTDGMIVNVNIGAWGVVISRKNPIRVTVNKGSHSVVNTTLPGHMLYSGTVTRQLREKKGNIVLHTKGVGSGRVQGSLNYIFCSPLLDHTLPRQDTPSGAANNIAAAIVWGAVDAGLKKRIHEGDGFKGGGGSDGGAGASGSW